MSNRRVFIRSTVYVVYLGCLVLYALFYGSKYEWMDDGSLSLTTAGSSEPWAYDSSSNRSVFRGVVATTAVGLQLLIYKRCSRLEAILTSILLIIVLFACW